MTTRIRTSPARYPSTMVAEARRLHEAEPGLSWRQLGLRLGVTGETAKRWAVPDYNEFVNARVKRNWERRKRAGRLPVAVLDRMVQLRVEGQLSHGAVAAVLNVDFGTRLKPDGVRRYLRLYAPDVSVSARGHSTANDRRDNFPAVNPIFGRASEGAVQVVLLDAHVLALRAHVRAAAEDTDRRSGWARAYTPSDETWSWHHLRELRDAGLLEWRDEWKDVLVRPTDDGWQVLSTLPFEAQP